jgi:hypothetical protein
VRQNFGRHSREFHPIYIDAGQQSRPKMTHMLSEAATKMAVLAAWRMLLTENARRRANELQANAHQCSRIAQSSTSVQVAEELEAIGRSFEQDANLLASRMEAAAYQLRLPWARLP